MEKIKSALQLTLEAEGWELFGDAFKMDEDPLKEGPRDWFKLNIEYNTTDKNSLKVRENDSKNRTEKELKAKGIRDVRFAAAYDPIFGNQLFSMYAIYVKI
jgi:hypothetical protein